MPKNVPKASLSTQEFINWHYRYVEAQREFARERPEIILCDAVEGFRDKSKQERLALFTDLAHLTANGNRLLAEVIHGALVNQGALSGEYEHD